MSRLEHLVPFLGEYQLAKRLSANLPRQLLSRQHFVPHAYYSSLYDVMESSEEPLKMPFASLVCLYVEMMSVQERSCIAMLIEVSL